MNLSLIQPVLSFLAALTIASTIGIASYVLIRLLCERPYQLGLFVCTFIAIISVAALCFAPTGLMLIGSSSVLLALATLADRAVQPSQESWLETFFKIAIASICATLLSVAFWSGCGGIFDPSLPSLEVKGFSLGYLMGALFSPSVSAIFLWMWKTILLRPGIERHLREEERGAR